MKTILCGFLMVLFGMSIAVQAAGVPLQIVAITGTSVPGISGATFANVFTPGISQDGGVLFNAVISGNVTNNNSTIIEWGQPGSLKLVHRNGGAAPGLNDVLLLGDSLGAPVGNGGLSLYSNGYYVNGTYTPSYGSLWLIAPASVNLVAHDGDSAPDAGTTYAPDALVSNSLSDEAVMNATGSVAFVASLGSSSNNVSDQAIFHTGTDGEIHLLARTGGASGSGPFYTANYQFDRLRINGAGDVLFNVQVGTSNNVLYGMFIGHANGTITSAQIQGDDAPGTSGLTIPNDPSPGTDKLFENFSAAGFNDAGQVIFFALLELKNHNPTSISGIWAGSPGSVQLLALDGNLAPGTTATWNTGASVTCLANNGYYAFQSAVNAQDSVSNVVTGIWIGKVGTGTPSLIALDDNQAPGLASGVTFRSFAGLNALEVNAQGEVYFSAVTSDGNTGIWKSDAAGNVQLVIASNQNVTYTGGVTKKVSQFMNFNSGETFKGGGHDGLSSGLNDAGLFAFVVQHTDGSQAVIRAGTAPVVTVGVDAQIAPGADANSGFVGEGIVNATGRRQTIITKADRGSSMSYTLEIENTGSATDSFTVKGGKGSVRFPVSYFDGTTDITTDVTKGTYVVSALAGGATKTLGVVVGVDPKAQKNSAKNVLVTVKSQANKKKLDAVKVKTIALKELVSG
jgi:hypothetical protein